jgi:hypothetical protein
MSIWLNGISSYMAIASISYTGSLIVHKEHNKIAQPSFKGFIQRKLSTWCEARVEANKG